MSDYIFREKYLKYKEKYLSLKQYGAGNTKFDYKDNNHVFSDYNTFKKRKNKVTELLHNKIKFNNKMFLIGFGAIGKVLLFFIINFIQIDSTNITIIDEKDFIADLAKISKLNFNIHNKTELTQFNYKTILKNLSANYIIIYCSANILFIIIYNLYDLLWSTSRP